MKKFFNSLIANWRPILIGAILGAASAMATLGIISPEVHKAVESAVTTPPTE